MELPGIVLMFWLIAVASIALGVYRGASGGIPVDAATVFALGLLVFLASTVGLLLILRQLATVSCTQGILRFLRRGDALADGGDRRVHLLDDGPASGRHAEKAGEPGDALSDLGERVRVEGDDLGVGRAELAGGVGGDGADCAQVLGQDQVRLQLLKQLAVDRVQRAADR
jgi:hypothetical protein